MGRALPVERPEVSRVRYRLVRGGYELAIDAQGRWLYWTRLADGAVGLERDDGVLWCRRSRVGLLPIGIEGSNADLDAIASWWVRFRCGRAA